MGEKRRLLVKLVTGRTIDQGVGKECGKASKEYVQSVSVCYIDPDDMRKLGIKEKTNVQVFTEHGAVVVTALKSKRAPHSGVVYIPYGPWANMVIDPETDEIGMPSLKGIPAYVEPAPDKPVMDLKSLLNLHFGRV